MSGGRWWVGSFVVRRRRSGGVCLCIVAFEVLNGARGDARGDTGRGSEPPRAGRYTARDLPGEAGAIGTHAGSDRRRGAPLSSGHRARPPGNTAVPSEGARC